MLIESSSSFREALVSAGFREYSFGRFHDNARVIGASYENGSGCCLKVAREWDGSNMVRHHVLIHIAGEGCVFDEDYSTETMATAWEFLHSHGLVPESPGGAPVIAVLPRYDMTGS